MQRTANVGYSSETSRRVALGRGHTDDRYGEETVTRRHGRDRQQSLPSRRLPWTANGRQRVGSDPSNASDFGQDRSLAAYAASKHWQLAALPSLRSACIPSVSPELVDLISISEDSHDFVFRQRAL